MEFIINRFLDRKLANDGENVVWIDKKQCAMSKTKTSGDNQAVM